jgi:hypothetical protein
MPHDQPYLQAEKKIEQARHSGATELYLSKMELTELPESLGTLTQLQYLYLYDNYLTEIPEWMGQLNQLYFLHLFNNMISKLPISLANLSNLQVLHLNSNKLTTLPDSISQLNQLKLLYLNDNELQKLPESLGNLLNLKQLFLNRNELDSLPDSIGRLSQLQLLNLSYNKLTDLSPKLVQLSCFDSISFEGNPLNPELIAAHSEGNDTFKHYLAARTASQIKLNEAKLILIGEGEVGKTCLMDALLGNPWQVHGTTHGIEIKPTKVTDPDSKTEITLNGWDFGGQRVYRPTHQLFFSAPAVYLVVWKPREGPQQGFVKEWIQLVKRREPSAKIIVVATHGGPQQRQPDIDRQELWDAFGKETVVDFFFVDSKPDKHGDRKGIAELKDTIARVAAKLPEVGRSVPKSFADVRAALQATGAPYLPLDKVLAICRTHNMDDEIARLFITISHRLGHLTHYENDLALRDIVILRPDWLATAMSYVLDDEQTRAAHGLVKFSRLGQLWDDPTRPTDTRYPASLHRIFLALMGRFDLSYLVADPSPKSNSDPQSLIAQLVPDNRPENIEGAWLSSPSTGNIQQTQICRIVDKQTGQSATAEGLFYQLIVRLHKYSLGRMNYNDSVHWQRGLILDDDYNGRALLRYIGNDVHITVRAPYPEFFLAMLTREVKYLVESFWEGLRCDVMVPCINPCGRKMPGTGLFEVEKLIDSKRNSHHKFPCPVCTEWQNIDSLLLNAPAAQPDTTTLMFTEFAEVKAELAKARQQIMYIGEKTMKRFDRLDDRTRRTLSQVDKTYTDLLQVLTNEVKDGPRLFSLMPLDRNKFNPREWIRTKFLLTLWCEHSRLPIPVLNGKDSKKGVYELDLDREWFKKAAPFLKLLTSTLSLVLPVASSAIQLALDDSHYKTIDEQLNFGKSIIDAAIGEGTIIADSMGIADTTKLEQGEAITAHGAILRELHSFLKAKDPGFGGLVRVLNKRNEFLWVHEKFAGEY